jgi:hypothetical protein
MREVCSLIWLALVGAFRSRVSLEAENTILRHQLNVLRRKSPKRPTFGMLDRLIFAGLYRLAPKVLGALAIVKPETVLKWHRAGYSANMMALVAALGGSSAYRALRSITWMATRPGKRIESGLNVGLSPETSD